jgi:transcriptional regulator with XRE-family HTH domain
MRPANRERIRKDVGRRISELRRIRGLTQEDFAALVQVSTPYIARVEGGSENLTLDSLTKLANILRATVIELFEPPRSREVRRGRPPKGLK